MLGFSALSDTPLSGLGGRPSSASAVCYVTAPPPTFGAGAQYLVNVLRIFGGISRMQWDKANTAVAEQLSDWSRTQALPDDCDVAWAGSLQVYSELSSPVGQLTKRVWQSTADWESGVPTLSEATERFESLNPKDILQDQPWEEATAKQSEVTDTYKSLAFFPAKLNVPWATGVRVQAENRVFFSRALEQNLTAFIPWQVAARPRYTVPLPVVPVVPPTVYNPTTILNFLCEFIALEPLAVTLNFGRHPCPPPGGLVPVQKVYFIVNTIYLKRVSDNTDIKVTSASVGTDTGSWCWALTASVPHTELEKVEPTADGPVEVELGINGLAWRFLIEEYDSQRRFAKSSVSLKGRSVTAYLDSPYAPARSFAQSSAISSRAFAEAELTRPGLVLGFGLDWTLVDALGWPMPANTWSYNSLTPMQVIKQLAEGGGGYVSSHPSAKTVQVRAEYPSPYWAWSTGAADLILPKSAVRSQTLRWSEKPQYNGVYVAGESTGVLAFVKRTGTAGELQAPMFVNPVISANAAARQKGLSIISAGGKQAEVSLELPLLSSLGLVTPGLLIEVVNGGADAENAWRGLVRGVSIAANFGSALEVTQSINLERHYGVF